MLVLRVLAARKEPAGASRWLRVCVSLRKQPSHEGTLSLPQLGIIFSFDYIFPSPHWSQALSTLIVFNVTVSLLIDIPW